MTVRGRVLAGAAFSVVAGISGFAGLLYSLRTHTDLGPAVVQANRLIASVGGPAKVCDEGKRIFKRLGTKGALLGSAELKDSPAIAALAQQSAFGAANLLPGSSIYVRFGTHLDGFTIEIVDKDSCVPFPKSSEIYELMESCIFVHR
jgi:hypothetical protein